MDLKLGETYVAFKSDNPLKTFKFTPIHQEDLFFDAKIVEGLPNIEFWKPYTVSLVDSDGQRRYLEIAPYHIDEDSRIAKFIVLGYLIERRKFVRFNVEELNIPIEGENFKGIVENVSLGGVKIKLLHKEGEIKENEPIFVKAKVEGKEYNFIITPVKVGENFISAKFEKPAKVTAEFFYHCLKLLQKETQPISEKRHFRRFYVEPLNIIVDTPLGVGVMRDISLGGMRVKLKKTYNVDEEIITKPFSVSCFIPSKNEEYIVECKLVNKTADNQLQLKITKWDEEALRLVSRILELLVENKKV